MNKLNKGDMAKRCPYMRIIFFGRPLSWSVFCIYYPEQLEYKPCATYKGYKCPLNLTSKEIEEKHEAFAKALKVSYAFFPPKPIEE